MGRERSQALEQRPPVPHGHRRHEQLVDLPRPRLRGFERPPSCRRQSERIGAPVVLGAPSLEITLVDQPRHQLRQRRAVDAGEHGEARLADPVIFLDGPQHRELTHGQAAPRRRLAEHARGMLVRPLEELQQRLGLAAAIGIRH